MKYSSHSSSLSEAVSRSQGADGTGSRKGSTGQRLPACSQRSRQEAEGLRRGEEPQCCDHVSREGKFADAEVSARFFKWCLHI